MVEALLTGETDPHVLAGLARGRMKAKRVELERALVRQIKPHHHFLMSEQLRHMDCLDEAIQRVGQEIEVRMSAPEAAPQ